MKNSPDNFIVAFRGEARRKGFSQVPNVVTLDKTLSFPAYRLYSLLVSYAMQSGGSVASQGAMAEDLASTDRSIRNWLKELEDHELISIHRQGQMMPNVYLIEDAYELYDAKKPKAGTGKQVSPEPPFRSPQEPAFRSNRNNGSAQAGSAVPTLNKISEKNKEKNLEISASLFRKEKTEQEVQAYKAGTAILKAAVDNAEKNAVSNY